MSRTLWAWARLMGAALTIAVLVWRLGTGPHKNRGFKAQIGALEILDAEAKVHAQREGNAGKEDKEDVALAGAPAGEEQLLELMGAAQRAGNSRGYAQFEQKLYQQILKVHRTIVS